jgi:hypothetical protein
MIVYASLSRPSNVRAHRVELEGIAQKPWHDRINQGVIQEISKLFALVGEAP